MTEQTMGERERAVELARSTKEIIDACELQWQHVGNDHAACRFCGFVVFVGADATIEDHMKQCALPATRRREGVRCEN